PAAAADDAPPTQRQMRFDCAPSDALEVATAACPTRIVAPEASLRDPAAALDPVDAARLAVAAVESGEAGGRVVLHASVDGGRTFAPLAPPAPPGAAGPAEVALVAAPDARLVLAAGYGSGALAVWTLPGFPDPGAALPEAALLPVAGAPRSLSATRTPDGRLALAWLEGDGPASTLRAAWTNGTAWTATNATGSLPCARVSALRGGLNGTYAACAPTPDANLTVVRLDPLAGNLTRVWTLPYGGVPHLAVDPSDIVAVLGLDAEAGGAVHARIALGRHGVNFTRPNDAGLVLHGDDAPAASGASVLAFDHVAMWRSWRLIYRETPAATDAPLPTDARERKWIVSLALNGRPLGMQSLDVDNVTARAARLDSGLPAPYEIGARDAVATLGTRELVAYQDAGTLVVGEVIELGEGGALPEAVPASEPVRPATEATSVIQVPPPRFTVPFIVAASVLAGVVVLRILAGPSIYRVGFRRDKP
ncbi:MAG TPA: hypothetical protein VHH36_04255, partial [Candidatus Thermoplasmatota archaeon]|nr:hypothetical protein [Candidatus Thermoplasmatota archaeon]